MFSLFYLLCFNHRWNNIKFGEWVENNKNPNCFFILQFSGNCEFCIVKFNPRFAYGLIDSLTGGTGAKDEVEDKKEFTSIEICILEDIEKIFTANGS